MCSACDLPTEETERALAERICKAACDTKCPTKTCPLRRFEDETDNDYSRRCDAAAQLAQAAAEREAADDFPEEVSEEFTDEVTDELGEIGDNTTDII